jgi:hypothetical protein
MAHRGIVFDDFKHVPRRETHEWRFGVACQQPSIPSLRA